MKFFDALWRCFAGPPASEFLDDLRAANFNRVSAELRDALESLEDMKAEADRHSEAAASARLRLLKAEERVDGLLKALDKARNDADVNLGRIVELEIENSDLSTSRNKERERADALALDAKAAKEAAAEAKRVAGLTLKQFEIYQDAVKMLVERGALSPIEVAQLNLGTFIPGVDGLPPSIKFGDVTEGKTSIDFGMKSQATEAKYRQTKEHFQRYQGAVRFMLDQIDTLGKANHVTKEDLRKLRDIRTKLSQLIQRSI